jgi:hypothetical protein
VNPAHLQHAQPVREAPSVASQSELAPYFPNGGVAAPPFMIVSPLSHSPGTDPGNGTPNQIIGPPTAEWIIPRASDTQGRGVPAFKRWARQFHSEAYDHSSMLVMPFPDQVAAIPSGPDEEQLVNDVHQRTEKAGWSMPVYGEQYEQPIAAAGMGTGPINIADPRSVAFALGWGYVGG